ncbi:cytochrome P450 [Variovorax sp. LjRoot290]|uniref:cytochrome P450 n=1 Tax=Variovorax sp. LjRoot290 TaxID=3342316 RepID=UPI003ECDB1A7
MPDDAVQEKSGSGLSLAMALEDPGKLEELMTRLEGSPTKERIDAAFREMKTIHYARFLSLRSQGTLLVIAEFDGETEPLVRALAAALDRELTLILGYMKDRPLLPVGTHQDEFWTYVQGRLQGDMSLFSAYPKKTVRAIVEDGAVAQPPAPRQPASGRNASENGISDSPVVGGGFSLIMTLEDPRMMRELMTRLVNPSTKGRIDAALESLDYVHFARFLPLPELGLLMIVTEFDGVMRDYVLDFAAVLDREFSMILGYMKERPPLPVSEYPNEFWDYVEKHIEPNTSLFSAYPDKTVLDIVGPEKRKKLPPRPQIPPVTVNQEDVQANVLRSFGATEAFYYYLNFPDSEQGRRFVAEFKATPGGYKPALNESCRNIAFTYAGLQALQLPETVLDAFPRAFQEGPAKRAARLDEEDSDSAPRNWSIGLQAKGEEVHAVVSLHCRADANPGRARAELERLITEHELKALHGADKELYSRSARSLGDHRVHFGYRDGIAQPRIAGTYELTPGGPMPNAVPGDFLLGPDYVNSRGGRYIGKLPAELALNATYAAYRVIEQDVAGFENWLRDTAKDRDLDPELLAAKLVGRWRDGTPLTNHASPLGGEDAMKAIKAEKLDDFDYVTPEGTDDDQTGLRCPIGAHTRRVNPRGGMVLGVPWGRLVLRRGMPYGPAYDSTADDSARAVPRGLVGMFMCGDLESQFEFLLSVWGRQDLSSPGLRGTQDPFIATRPTPFSFSVEGPRDAIPVEVPALTRTKGSLYLFMPGLGGLRWIGQGAWLKSQAQAIPAPPSAAAGRTRAALPAFVPGGVAFRNDPYRFFADFREHQPVYKVAGGHNSLWVFSNDLVREVCEKKELFLKPGKNRAPQRMPFGINGESADGLFFMDPPRHGEVRPVMEGLLGDSVKRVLGHEPEKGRLNPALLDRSKDLLARLHGAPTMNLVEQFASRLPTDVFMEVMGIPSDSERLHVEHWARAMLKGHDPDALPQMRSAAGTASLAMHAYFAGVASVQGASDQPCTLMSGMRSQGRCPMSRETGNVDESMKAKPMSMDEITNTASHFALGGFLSTEFLITTGIYNLLRHPEQWKLLKENPELLENAVWEMLRYEAPFQMADRWVAEDCEEDCSLGGYPLSAKDKVTVVYGSANRDSKYFENPDLFDIRRKEHRDRIYGFGHGIHNCIGATLAWEVTKAAVAAFLDEFPKASLAEATGWWPDPYFRSLTEVKIALA